MSKKQNDAGAGKLLWKFFASVKLSVVVLILIAATSILGTLIPQNAKPSLYFAKYGPLLFDIFNVLDLFDMYHSWWFQFLLMLLTVNIIVCSIDRFKFTWKIVSGSKKTGDPSRFRRVSNKQEFDIDQEPEKLVEAYQRVVKKKFAECRVEQNGEGAALFAEKGRWTRLGVYAVHLSVVFLLSGGLLGSIFGFEGFITVPEGEQGRVITLKGEQTQHPLNFDIRCDRFDVSFYDSGAPREYRSVLTLLENDTPVLTEEILVNKPLRYKGISIYQSSYGTVKPKSVMLKFVSRKTGNEYNIQAAIGEEIIIPENLGKISVTNFMSSSRFNLGETFVASLTSEDGKTIDILLPVRFARFDKMRKGDVVVSVSDFERSYYTGLQITKDPGVYVVYAGFIMMIIGCYITFFMSHQRLCIEIIRQGKQSRVMVAGIADRNKFGMQSKIKNIAQRLIDV